MDNLKNLIPNATAYGKALNLLGNNKNGISNISDLTSTIAGLNKEQTKSFLVQNDLLLGINSLTDVERKRHQAGLEKLLLTKKLTVEEAKLTATEIMNTVAKKANVEATEKQNKASLSFKGTIGNIGDTLKGVGAKLLDFAKTPSGMATIVTTGISIVTMAMDAYKKHIQEIIDKGKELTKQWEEQKKAIQSNGETIQFISTEYERLARGVSDQGINISLSTEEYKRYNEIVNQIADMFPTMISGYTTEGNAIIIHKGNVEALTEAYIEMKEAAQDAILLGASDKWKAFAQEYVNKTEWTSGDIEKGIYAQYDLLQQLLSLKNDRDAFIEKIEEFSKSQTTSWAQLSVLSGVDLDPQSSPEEIYDRISDLQRLSNNLFRQLNSATSDVKPILNTYLDTNLDFQKIETDVQDKIKTLLGHLDFNFYKEFETKDEMYNWLDKFIIEPLKDKSKANEVQNALAFLLSPDFKKGISAADYAQQVQEAFEKIESILGTTIDKDLRIKLGIDDTAIIQELKNLLGDIGRDSYGLLSDLLISTLTIDELKDAYNILSSIEDITDQFMKGESLVGIFNNKQLVTDVRSLQSELDNGQISYVEYGTALDELGKKLNDPYVFNTFIEIFGRTAPAVTSVTNTVISEFNRISEEYDKLTSAMSKAKNGEQFTMTCEIKVRNRN